MQQLLAMTRKELRLWAQKPGNWVIVFLVPLVFIWIMYAVFGGGGGTPVVTVYAVNEDEGDTAAQVIDALHESANLEIDLLETRTEADRLVGTGERMAAVIIPEGFSEAVQTDAGGRIEVIIDPARSEQANIVVGLVNAAIGPLIVDAEVNRGVARGVSQVIDALGPTSTPEGTPPPPTPEFSPTPSATPTMEPSPTPEEGEGQDDGGTGQEEGEPPQPTPEPVDLTGVDTETMRTFLTAALKGVVGAQVQDAVENPLVQVRIEPYLPGEAVRQPSLLDFLVPGYSLMFVFFLSSSLAMTVIEERETGALRRLLSAPVPRSRILLGKLLPYFLIGVAQMVFVLMLSRFIFGIDLGSAPAGLAMIILSTALAMAGLGILIAALAKSAGQADGLATTVALAMAIVSGALFPSIFVPGVQLVTPHYWAMQGFVNIIARGQGVSGALLPSAVMVIMAVVFFTAGAIKFRFD